MPLLTGRLLYEDSEVLTTSQPQHGRHPPGDCEDDDCRDDYEEYEEDERVAVLGWE